jgi:hypothetical protein
MPGGAALLPSSISKTQFLPLGSGSVLVLFFLGNGYFPVFDGSCLFYKESLVPVLKLK